VTYVLLALGTAVAIALGVFGVVFGEADDSPGLQVLGALLVIGAVTYAVRTVRRLRRPQGGHP
jgi:hypothetical protein